MRAKASEPRGMRQARARRKRSRPAPPPAQRPLPGRVITISRAIVDRLFTRGDGVRADRLVLVDRENLYLSGWGDGPVRDVIIDELMKAGVR